MESTKKHLFDSDDSEWFLALGKKSLGPFSASELYEMIQKQEVTMAHFACKKGMKDWKRICEMRPFSELSPQAPETEVPPAKQSPEIRKAAVKKVQRDNWYLYVDQVQKGPFSTEEVQRLVDLERVVGDAQIWQDGMKGWAAISEIEPFKKSVKKAPAQEKNKNQRTASRRPLVARIFVSNEETMVIGICRDISVGGMQVLTDRIPGNVGARIRLNVSPSDAKELSPFVAEGEIVRVLEDGLGFSFRFDELDSNARKSIQAFIAS